MDLDAWAKYGFSKATLLRRDRSGVVIEREPLDPSLLKPVVDWDGKQKPSPYPAWQYRQDGQLPLMFTQDDIEIEIEWCE